MRFQTFLEAAEKSFDPQVFFTAWVMSKKDRIPLHWIKYLAEKYPYSGRAFRLDTSPHGAPLSSWSKSLDGLIEWKSMMPGNALARTPEGFSTYRGMITKGIDIAAFVADNDFSDMGEKVIRVEEVTPVVPVKKIVDIEREFS